MPADGDGSVQVGVRVEEEDMRTGARTHCCSAYLTFVAVAARTAGVSEQRVLQLQRTAPCAQACPADLPTSHQVERHLIAGPMQPLRALPRVVPTQPAHRAIHAEAEVWVRHWRLTRIAGAQKMLVQMQ
jgi:acyl-CoA hydrolase